MLASPCRRHPPSVRSGSLITTLTHWGGRYRGCRYEGWRVVDPYCACSSLPLRQSGVCSPACARDQCRPCLKIHCSFDIFLTPFWQVSDTILSSCRHLVNPSPSSVYMSRSQSLTIDKALGKLRDAFNAVGRRSNVKSHEQNRIREALVLFTNGFTNSSLGVRTKSTYLVLWKMWRKPLGTCKDNISHYIVEARLY